MTGWVSPKEQMGKVHAYYLEVLPGLGYAVVVDAQGEPARMTIYEKDGVRLTMFITPQVGGDGSEDLAYVGVIKE